ncbi:hypothetical protein Tco_0896743 [Tanacetum coccineum]
MGWVVCSDAVLESCDAVLIFVVTASRCVCDAVSSHCREILDQCWCRVMLVMEWDPKITELKDNIPKRILSGTFADLPAPETKWEEMAPTPVPRLDGASIQINELFYVFFGYRTLDENESNKDEDESTSGGSDDGSDTQAKKPESSVTKKDDTTPSTCHEKKLKSTDLIEEKQKEVIVEKVREPTKSHVNEETNAEHMIKEEAKFLRVAMGHDDEDIDEFVEIHKTCLNDVMYFPTHDAYGLSSVAGNMEKHTASKKGLMF